MPTRWKHIWFVLAQCGLLMAYGQTNTGAVSGVITGEQGPLELASVTLLKTSYATLTDSNGHFFLTGVPAGKYQLRISYVGHENHQQQILVSANGTAVVSTTLIPLAAKLNEIVVTGTLKEVSKLQSITPVDAYSIKYFLRNPSNNFHEALANINGIFPDVDNGVSNTTDVQINGLEGNYTMFLIDGVPAMNGLAGIYALNALPVSMIDKVEVVKGAASMLYGSEAIAGIINIKTANPAHAPRLAINTYLDSKLAANLDITTTIKLKRVSSLIAASANVSNYKWDIDHNNFTDVPLTNRANFYNKWSFNRKENRLAFIYARYLFEDRFGGEMNMRPAQRGSDSLYGEAITTHQWQAGFQYQFAVPGNLLLMADYSEHYQKAYFGANYFKGTQRTGFAQLSWSKKIDKVNELLLGAAYRIQYYKDNTGLSADSNTGGRMNHIAGIFLEDELNISKGHKLLLGVRFDYSTLNGPVFIPRINYKWNSKDEKNIIRIGAGTGYRVPNLMNEGFSALNGSRQIVVEEKLKPEVTINANAHYQRIQEIKSGLLNIDASVFYTYFFNLVNPDYDEDPELIVYSNSRGGAMASGFSIYTDFTFNYPLKVGAGFTFTNVFELEENEEGEKEKETPPHVPPFVANFFLSYSFPVPQLSIDWTGNVVSPMLLTAVPNDFRPGKSPWHTIQNIQLTKKFNNGLQIYLGLKNIFNFIQKDPILRPFDPFNKNVATDNPFNYRFDTTYGFSTTEGIKGFVGLRYILQ